MSCSLETYQAGIASGSKRGKKNKNPVGRKQAAENSLFPRAPLSAQRNLSKEREKTRQKKGANPERKEPSKTAPSRTELN